MRLSQFRIERFGAIEGLQMEGLLDGLNVVFGANGSGKTTVMQFLRAVFYGLPAASSERFLPVIHAGGQGGELTLIDEETSISSVLARLSDEANASLQLASSGGEKATGKVKRVLKEVGEASYLSLFTVGYREADSFEQLVADVLQRDEKHVVDVPEIGQIESALARAVAERKELLDDGVGSRIRKLAASRDRLVQELNSVGGEPDSGAQLQELTQEAERFEKEIAQVESEIRELDARIVAESAACNPATEQPCQPYFFAGGTAEQLQEIDREISDWQARCRTIDLDLVAARDRLGAIHQQGEYTEGRDTAQFDRARDCVQELKAAIETLNSQRPQNEGDSHLLQLRDRVFDLCREMGRQEITQYRELLSAEIRQLKRCRAESSRQLKLLRRRRQFLVDNFGVADSEWRRQAVTSFCSDAARHSYPAAQTTDITRDSELLEQLQVQREKLRLRRDDLVAKRRAILETIERARAEFGNAKSSRRDEIQLELNFLDQELSEAGRRLQAAVATEAMLNELLEQYRKKRHSRILLEASEYLSRLTAQAYDWISIDRSARTLNVRGLEDEVKPLSALSRGNRDQVALSLRLALANAYRREGNELPLVFDDVFLTADDDRSKAAVNLLRDYCENGQQIIFFTCREQISNLFRSMQVSVRELGQPVVAARPVQAPEATPKQRIVRDPVELPREPEPVKEPVVAQTLVPPQVPKETGWEPTENWIFHLEMESPISDLQGLSADDSAELQAIGVTSIEDLLTLVPDAAAIRLSHTGITPDQLRRWQARALLTCRTPMLRQRDSELLVECGIDSAEELAGLHPEDLRGIVERFLSTIEGRRFVRDDNPYDLQTCINWIRWSRHARNLWDSRENSRLPEQQRADRRSMPAPTRRLISASERSSVDGSPGEFTVNALDATSGVSAGASRTLSRSGSSSSGSASSGTSSRTRTSSSSKRSTKSSSNRSRSRTRGERTSRSNRTRSSTQRERGERNRTESSEHDDAGWKFYLDRSRDVEDAPSIGPKTAERLEVAGIITVGDLLEADPESVAETVNNRRITPERIREWQQQAELVCRIPQIRGHDAQILVACEYFDPDEIGMMQPNDLFAVVQPFVETTEGERIIRNGKKPDLEEVSDWIRWAQHARSLRAA